LTSGHIKVVEVVDDDVVVVVGLTQMCPFGHTQVSQRQVRSVLSHTGKSAGQQFPLPQSVAHGGKVVAVVGNDFVVVMSLCRAAAPWLSSTV